MKKGPNRNVEFDGSLALGMLEDVVVAIAFTGPAEDLTRLISRRRA